MIKIFIFVLHSFYIWALCILFYMHSQLYVDSCNTLVYIFLTLLFYGSVKFLNVSLYLVSCICDTLDDGLSKPKHVVKERV
jgi:hypothetical protein